MPIQCSRNSLDITIATCVLSARNSPLHAAGRLPRTVTICTRLQAGDQDAGHDADPGPAPRAAITSTEPSLRWFRSGRRG